jgi:hypothetical protein
MPPRHGVNNIMDNVYVAKFRVDDEEMNRQIIEVIDAQGDRQNQRTNVKADMTEWNMTKEPGFNKLAEIIKTLSIKASLNKYGKAINPFIKTMWGLKYKSGEFATPHHHWPAPWACVYYINPPKDAPGIYFTDYDEEIQIEHGVLYMFESRIRHEVKAKEFEGTRYCVAANIHSTSFLKEYLQSLTESLYDNR